MMTGIISCKGYWIVMKILDSDDKVIPDKDYEYLKNASGCYLVCGANGRARWMSDEELDNDRRHKVLTDILNSEEDGTTI